MNERFPLDTPGMYDRLNQRLNDVQVRLACLIEANKNTIRFGGDTVERADEYYKFVAKGYTE